MSPIASNPADQTIRIAQIQRLAQKGTWRLDTMRSHQRDVLIWFTRGQGRITVGGVTRGFGPHNAIFVPAGVMHCYDVTAAVSGVVAYLPKISHVTMPTSHTHLRIRDAQSQSELTGLLDTLQRELESDRPAAMQAASMYAGLLSVWIARQIETGDADAPKQTAATRLVAQYTDLIEHSLGAGLSAGNYAEQLGVTATHLSRVCKSTCGRNASTLLNERRISEARRLLAETKEPINAIASDLGYRSAAYFSRAFHDHTGATPTDFRRSA